MKKLNKIRVLTILLIVVLVITGCGGKNISYKKLDSVQGIIFQVPDYILNNATAIARIAGDMDYSKNTTYVYKDGSENFIMFQMGSIAVIVKKGTQYHFKDVKDKTAALIDNELLDTVWLEPSSKDFKCDETDKKEIHITTGRADAQIVITEQLYDDFTGYFKNISNGNEEWSIYAGVPVNIYEKLKSDDIKMLEKIADSLTYDNENQVEQDTEVEQPQTETKVKESEKEEPKTEEIEEVQTEIIDKKDENPEVSDKKEISLENDEKKDNQGSNNTPNNSEKEPEIKEDEVLKKGITVSNQNQSKKNTETDIRGIYNMASLGEAVSAPVISYDTGEIETPVITLNEIYTGKDAQKIIDDYFKSGSASSEYIKPQEGTKYQVAKYEVDYTYCVNEPYVNVKLRGLDGNNLTFRGIKYTKRTYDILSLAKKDGKKITDLYCYYEVPNGCKEYSLEFGDLTNEIAGEKNNMASYYHIEN